MGRPRTRVTLESGLRLDVADLTPKGAGRPGTRMMGRSTWSDGTEAQVSAEFWGNTGTLRLVIEGRLQIITLVPEPRHFGGFQWYASCPRTHRMVRVLYRPPGADFFASRHAWGRQVAYASQFEDRTGRAHRTQAKAKMRALGDADPDEWDFPPKPKRMRWATYERLERKFEEAEDVLNEGIALLVSRLLGRV